MPARVLKAKPSQMRKGSKESIGGGQETPSPAPTSSSSPDRFIKDTARQIYKDWQRQQSGAFPTVAAATPRLKRQSHEGLAKHQKNKHTQNRPVRPKAREKDKEKGTTMDLTYITERIISMCFPPDVDIAVFRTNLKEAADMLRTKHGENYMVFNFSEHRRDVARHNPRVMEQGWADDLAPPLERLCSICKSIDSWLNEHPHHIAVLHSMGGRERIGVVVAAYLHYSSICASADQALDRFAMKRFFDDKIGGLDTPSHKRYVNYFAGLLSGSIKINSDPLYLNHITVFGVPAYEPRGGCRAFVKVYQGMVPVYTSAVYAVTENTRQFTITMEKGLQLRGDILVKCYHRRPKPPSREVIFRCQFHTCAVSDSSLAFSRQELDDACYDLRFPLDGGVEFHFSTSPDSRRAINYVAVPLDTTPDQVTRWDSYEHLDSHSEGDEAEEERESPVNHTYGPVDGSLYATVTKKSASPVDVVPPSVAAPVTVTPVQNGVDSLVNSPHTVSMDSGISSAGNSGQREGHLSGSSSSPPHSGQSGTGHGQAHTTTTTVLTSPAVAPNGHGAVNGTDHRVSPNAVETRVEVHASPKGTSHHAADHSQLDELLSGMLLDVQGIPDLKPSQKMPGLDIDVDSIKINFDIPPRKTEVSKTYSVTRTEYSSVSSGYPPSQGHPSPLVSNGCAPSSGRASDYMSEDSLNTTQEEVDIPYHARQDSRPFTYGIITSSSRGVQRKDSSTSNVSTGSGPPSPSIHRRNSRETLAPSTGLQSPRLVRKVSGGGGTGGLPVISRAPLPTVTYSQEDALSSPQLRRKFGLKSPSPTHSPSVSPTVPMVPLIPSPQRSPSTSHSPILRPTSPSVIAPTSLEESIMDVTLERSSRYSENSMTWLQRQQKKLRERKEQQMRTERAPQESRLIHELRNVQSRMPSCRDEVDGYMSDTTLLLDTATSREDSPNKYGTSYTTPLHINTSGYNTYSPQQDSSQYMTSKPPIHSKGSSAPSSPILPSRSSSRDRTVRYNQYITISSQTAAPQPLRPVGRQQSDTSHDRERPFVAVKRAHEQDRLKSDSTQSPSVSPQALLAASPMGHIPYSSTLSARQDGGLLTTVEGQLGHDDSMSSWHTASGGEEPGSPRSTSPRPVTPAFPVQPRTPYVNQDSSPAGLPPKSPTTTRRSLGAANSGSLKNLRKWSSNSSVSSSKDRSPSPATVQQIRAGLMSQPNGHLSAQSTSMNGQMTPASVYYGLSRRSSLHSNSMEPQEVSPVHVKFVRDTSKYWYKPSISREEAINMLKDKDPGTFLVRDSNSFPGAFGLALKVAKPPPNVQNKTGDASTELVRHFLIEPTTKGVKLKGCSNEPVFGSLSALVYQHSITPLALPSTLKLPDMDPGRDVTDGSGNVGTAAQLLAQGAACNVLYLFTMDMESLTGPQAIKKAMTQLFLMRPLPQATIVHFKVSSQGITLTDNERRLFFRRHYAVATISFCGLDPEDRRWSQKNQETGLPVSSNRCFGFVARKPASKTDNQCHLFAELEPEQPASAIVNFVTKVMMSGPSDKVNIV